MLNFLNKNKYFFGLLFSAILVICATFHHNIGLIIDCGREAYYPQEILNGKVLYKDLFNIYGPFAYLFNAFLYKIFGNNLSTLCFAGFACALGIITTLFLITKKFLNDRLAGCLCFLTIVIGLMPVYIFNYVFPYAFAMTYGLLGFLISLLFLIYFIEKKSNLYLFISLFFAGLSVCCKYEFCAYLLVYLPVFFKFKPKFNTLFIGLLSFGLIPEICFATLFAKGLSLYDLKNTLNIIITMSQTQTLKYFYIHSGIFFHKQTVFALVITFLALCLPLFIYMCPILFKNLQKNQILCAIFTYLGFCLMIVLKNYSTFDIFMSLPIVLVLLTIFNFKKIFGNLYLTVLVLSAILVSLKVFWGVLLNSYGIYYLPILLLAIAIIFKDKFSEKDWDYIGFYFIVLALLMSFVNLKKLEQKNYLLQTPKGKIYVEKKYYQTTKDLINFIEKNTEKTDKILIYPEGMMINYLVDRNTDNFYNSFLPLYEETFGKDTHQKHFEKSMPKYVIFNSWNSSDYYFSLICKDYGLNFCEFIEKNYNKKIKLSGDFSYTIYEKK